MNRDVFLSLLTLDAYNRGYGQNIGNLLVSGKIGTATIAADALSELNPAQLREKGFYAIAYE